MRPARRGRIYRRCGCCGRSVIHVARTIAALTVRNPRDCDYPVELDAGAELCRVCVHHNGLERETNPVPPATVRRCCNRCGGHGKIRNPTLHRVLHGGLYDVPLRRRAEWWRCPKCLGEGEVAAA